MHYVGGAFAGLSRGVIVGRVIGVVGVKGALRAIRVAGAAACLVVLCGCSSPIPFHAAPRPDAPVLGFGGAAPYVDLGPAGHGPHGLCVSPQSGRHSLGRTHRGREP